MFFLENVRLAFGALVNNKMRSLLTMLGIIIGISSVIMITTIGNSLQKTLANTFGMLSEVGYQVDYGFKDFETEDASDWDFKDSDYITKEMLDTLYEEMDGKYLVSQQKWLGDATIRNSKNQMLKLSVSGASGGTMTSMVNIYKLIKGRYLTEEDTRRIKNAAMVSDVFIQQYFLDGEDPIGKSLSVSTKRRRSLKSAWIRAHRSWTRRLMFLSRIRLRCVWAALSLPRNQHIIRPLCRLIRTRIRKFAERSSRTFSMNSMNRTAESRFRSGATSKWSSRSIRC